MALPIPTYPFKPDKVLSAGSKLCPRCVKTFPPGGELALVDHLSYVHGEKIFICGEGSCRTWEYMAYKMARHINNKHDGCEQLKQMLDAQKQVMSAMTRPTKN